MKFLKVKDIINNDFATDSNGGTKLFNAIKNYLETNTEFPMRISFTDIRDISYLFLSSSIGRLLKYFTKEELFEKLRFTRLSVKEKSDLERVIIDSEERYNKLKEISNPSEDKIEDISNLDL